MFSLLVLPPSGKIDLVVELFSIAFWYNGVLNEVFS